ncbi:hypothetical protein [Saprospira grandis]|uniref:Uncharacterized protein n=1 Tax=Saprospira grandis (strain Lewin) TaxID=984262 RepID=H6L3Y2_SAPGL|nr:hypothetical protein [Saprospira grandis]AFC23864.1 hypothetical protein SGRA_1129 [Saprospira grandis str. Lewin]
MKKFEDNGTTLYDFYGAEIVGCPKCARPTDFIDLQVACIHCGFNKKFEPLFSCLPHYVRLTIDINYFLVIHCCGHVLWARNRAHLDFIERYVEADLRERVPNINRSLASRLPQWIKSRKNRTEILKAIAKMKAALKKYNYQPNKAIKAS